MTKNKYLIHLHGFIGDIYGTKPIVAYGRNIQEAFKWIGAKFGQNFTNVIHEGAWHLTVGKRNSEELHEEDTFVSEDTIEFNFNEEEFHLFPAITGSGRGIGQIIMGVVLIVVAVLMFWNPLGWSAAVGAGATFSGSAIATVALAGVASLANGLATTLASNPSVQDYALMGGAEAKPSFIFNGIVNNIEQGVPVPLVYGLHLTGSTVISGGLDTVQVG